MEVKKILITNLFLRGVSGTETHVRDLSLELSRRQLEVAVFSPDDQGPVAKILAGHGIPVVRDPRECPFQPDIIHGHHSFALLMAIQAFPDSRAIFVCHDSHAWHDRAVRLPQIVGYFAVDELCRQRVVVDTGLAASQITVIGNGVDVRRFKPRGPLPERPVRALVFGHTASERTFIPIIRQACEAMDISLSVYGAYSGRVSESPENELPSFDLVFAKGRSAMEAMACGCAVILCGDQGSGPMLTPENFAEFKPWNFGKHLLTHPHDKATLMERIEEYNPSDVALLTSIARERLALTDIVDMWQRAYSRLPQRMENQVSESGWVDELQHLYVQLDRLHWLEYLNLCQEQSGNAGS